MPKSMDVAAATAIVEAQRAKYAAVLPDEWFEGLTQSIVRAIRERERYTWQSAAKTAREYRQWTLCGIFEGNAIALALTQMQEAREMSDDPVENLRRAVEEVNRDHPLPRCPHGQALRDGGGERLEPPCGCRAKEESL